MAGLMYEGSRIPESVQRAAINAQYGFEPVSMQQARAAQEAASRAAVEANRGGGWAEGARSIDLGKAGGLLKSGASALGRALGPAMAAGELGTSIVGGIQDRWQLAQDLVQKRDTRQAVEADPGLPGRGQAAVNRITENAMSGVRGLLEQGRAAAKAPEDRSQAIAMPVENQAAVEVAKEAAPEIEAGRQRIEAGTLQGLQSGEVHVSDLAKGVVQADAQRAGATLKPEEEKAAIETEIKAMKTMDKDQLSKYVSYALVAGGILASVFDKTGEAGRMFHDSFNKQLDRNLASGKMAFDQQMAVAKNAREDRKVDISETDVTSKVKNREVTADQGERRLRVMDYDSQTKRQSAIDSAASRRESNSIAREGLEIRREGLDLRKRAQDFKEKNGGGMKGEAMSTKDATGAVEAWAKEKGLNISGDVKSSLAQSLRNAARDPNTKDFAIGDILDTLQDDYETTDSAWYQSGSQRVRRPKE